MAAPTKSVRFGRDPWKLQWISQVLGNTISEDVASRPAMPISWPALRRRAKPFELVWPSIVPACLQLEPQLEWMTMFGGCISTSCFSGPHGWATCCFFGHRHVSCWSVGPQQMWGRSCSVLQTEPMFVGRVPLGLHMNLECSRQDSSYSRQCFLVEPSRPRLYAEAHLMAPAHQQSTTNAYEDWRDSKAAKTFLHRRSNEILLLQRLVSW